MPISVLTNLFEGRFPLAGDLIAGQDPPMVDIEVYADIWCPFTHVGLRRLTAERSLRRSSAVLRIRPWPLELVNGAAMDAAFIGEEIRDLRTQVASDLFRGFRKDRFPTTTLPALALTESAYSVSNAVGERMALTLRDALFEEGLDISNPNVLIELAMRLETPLPEQDETDMMSLAWADGKDRGVVGSPHFFVDSGDFFCPTLEIERVDGHLRITQDLPAFDAFVDSCFGPG